MTPHERYQALAEQWHNSERPRAQLQDGYSLIALRCWAFSDGAKKDGVSDLVKEFIRASEAAQRPNWLDAYFDDRETCRSCGESYRFENVSLCTACGSKYCHRCKWNHGTAANGNAACACGKGELVG